MPGYMLHHNQTGHPVMGEIAPRRTAVFIGHAYCFYMYNSFRANNDFKNTTSMKTAVRLGPISPITGCPIGCDGIRKPGMRIRDKPSFTYLATLSHP